MDFLLDKAACRWSSKFHLDLNYTPKFHCCIILSNEVLWNLTSLRIAVELYFPNWQNDKLPRYFPFNALLKFENAYVDDEIRGKTS